MEKMRKYCCVISVFCVSLFAFGKKDLSKVDMAYYALIDSAEVCINRSDWTAAENFTKKALKLKPEDPNNSMLLCNLATIQRFEQRYEDALSNYNKALSIEPKSTQLLHNRARLFMEVGMYDEAKADYMQIVSLDKKDVEALYNHGMICINIDSLDVAYKDFQSILKMDPMSKFGKEGMAMWNKMSGKTEEAIALYTELIKYDTTSVLLSQRADCYIKIDMYNEASADINEAISLDPEDGFLYLIRGKLNRLRFNKNDAYRDMQLAIKYGISAEAAKKAILEK